MSLTPQEVEHIAKLARLGLAKKEKEILAKELSSILAYVDKLQAIDVKKVAPTAQVTGLVNVMREDEIEQFKDNNEILKQAPAREKNYIKVKKVFEN